MFDLKNPRPAGAFGIAFYFLFRRLPHGDTPQNVQALLLTDVYSVGSLNSDLKESLNTSDISRKGGAL